MRGRHFPRLCRSCEAPLARKDDVCWRCDAAWVDHDEAAPSLESAGASTTSAEAPVEHAPDERDDRVPAQVS